MVDLGCCIEGCRMRHWVLQRDALGEKYTVRVIGLVGLRVTHWGAGATGSKIKPCGGKRWQLGGMWGPCTVGTV